MAEKRMELDFRLAGRETAAEQAGLFNRVFQMNATEASWKRKYMKNPLAGEQLLVFAAFSQGKVVGINGFLPMEYEYEGKIYRVVQSCDTAVDPDYRGQGIFTRTIRAAERYFSEQGYDAMVGFPNKNSYPGFLKMGWTEHCRQMKYFFPCNVSNVAKDMLGKRLPKFLDPLAGLWHGVHTLPYLFGRGGYIVEESSTVTTEDFYAFLPKDKMRIHISQEYLDWKLSAGHCLYTVKKNGEMVCRMLICDYIADEHYHRGNILGVLSGEVSASTFRKGLSILIGRLRKKYDILSVWECSEKKVNRSFSCVGFLKNWSEKNGSPFILKCLTEDPQIKEVLMGAAIWEPSFLEADYVMDHNV